MAWERMEKKILLNGEWRESESMERMEIIAPGDGNVIGTVPRCGREDARMAVEAACEGRKALARMSLLERLELLHKAQEIASGKDAEASRILCLESGKPWRQAVSEASPKGGYSWSNFQIATANVKTHRGMTLPNVTEASNSKRVMFTFEPIGVVVNLSTFSYPSEMPNCSFPYALALGNPVIVKPSRGTPYSAIFIAESLHEAGFPAGSIGVLTGEGDIVGDELAGHPETNAVALFGQESTAEKVVRKGAFKKLLLAVVSNNPLIVMDDADLDAAVAAAVGGAYGHNGQSPISTRRILVHKDVYEDFVDRFDLATGNQKVGDPLDPDTDIGPLQNPVALEIAMTVLEDARKKGAKFRTGGNNAGGLFMEPTILEDVTPEMKVFKDAFPGPISSVIPISSAEEAVELANGTRYGFQAGAFTSSLATAYFFSENLKMGSVYINESTTCWDEMAPFGGVKHSGMGRMLSDWTLSALTEEKMTLFDLSKVRK